MKRRLLAIFTAVLMLCTLAPTDVALAGTQGGCAGNPKPAGSVQLWENHTGDTSDGDDNIWLMCGAPAPSWVSDLSQFTHTLPGDCNDGIPPGQPTWNDCVSSVFVSLPSSLWVVCFYTEANFSGGFWHTGFWAITGPQYVRFNFPQGNPGVGNDVLSSFYLSNQGVAGCPNP